MDNLEIAERFADMWRRSRTDAGKSQDWMAKKLGVSKKTVQNWEAGIGCPNQLVGFKWFEVLGVAPLPYYLELMYPNQFKGRKDRKDVATSLIRYIYACNDHQREELLFILCGQHGSSTAGLLEELTAYLHLPLEQRIGVAQLVYTSFILCSAAGRLSETGEIMPDADMLSESIGRACEAAKNRGSGYANVRT